MNDKKYDIEAIPGERWFPKETSLEEDLGRELGAWGVNSEVDKVKAVLMRRRGK